MLSKSFDFQNWKIIENKSHILKQEGNERMIFEEEIKMPMYPDMIFNNNFIEIVLPTGNNSNEFNKIKFLAIDALKMVESCNERLKVASADVWQEANAHILNSDIVDQPTESFKSDFDWTFSTKYTGTLFGNWEVISTDERINYEVLKEKEPILFFSEMSLFEDELGDNGCVQLMLRLRVMKSGFFLLQRFFLRVDGRLVRIFDTRLCCGAAIGSDDYFLREVRFKESSKWSEKMSGVSIMEAEAFCDKDIDYYCEKLSPRCNK